MKPECLSGSNAPKRNVQTVTVNIPVEVEVIATETYFEVVGVNVPKFRSVVEEMRRQLIDAGMPEEALHIR